MIFTPQQFQLMQSLINEMYQSDMLRSGPMGGIILSIRSKFLIQGNVDLTDGERRFLLGVLIDVNITSRSPAVQSQYGLTMKFQSPTPLDDPNQSPTQLSSSTSQISTRTQNGSFSSSTLKGSYLSMWYVLQQCMTLLGEAAPPPYKQPAFGPTGQPGGITPLQDTNDDDRMM